MTRRLEERVTCKDTEGLLYEVEVYREVTRLEDGSQEIGRRTAFIEGDPARPVQAWDDENTFQTREGSILRRVRVPARTPENPKGQG